MHQLFMLTLTGETSVQPTDSAGLPGGRAHQLQPGDRGPGRFHLRLQHREAEQRGQSVHQPGGGRHSGPTFFSGEDARERERQKHREKERDMEWKREKEKSDREAESQSLHLLYTYIYCRKKNIYYYYGDVPCLSYTYTGSE